MKKPHCCRALIPNPSGDGFVRCMTETEEQCHKCKHYFCHDDTTHLIVCGKCAGRFCEKDFSEHKGECEQVREAA